MKLIIDNLPATEGIEEDGSVEFIHGGHMFNIGTLDGVLWISRQTLDDYENGRNNWERIERWIPENTIPFKFLRNEQRF